MTHSICNIKKKIPQCSKSRTKLFPIFFFFSAVFFNSSQNNNCSYLQTNHFFLPLMNWWWCWMLIIQIKLIICWIAFGATKINSTFIITVKKKMLRTCRKFWIVVQRLRSNRYIEYLSLSLCSILYYYHIILLRGKQIFLERQIA